MVPTRRAMVAEARELVRIRQLSLTYPEREVLYTSFGFWHGEPRMIWRAE
ncbi:hypothetical protein [Streptomyces rapamycinicus]|uniref:Uncharacterized protein n=2 Tax=Streptomyces rapamycinicus TaxID=1226757 RepID=A0A0A0NMV1_STRRN|nr:hypothetical protein [Streptomyces rapamycinicus]AGP58299.1 hypothetical protein M271_34435 [Streptomyces rapamycinicus NRRL 5491]MBB4785988.1 hypothetical protein [Streptomyces rapamycinicus]RLV78550.1 hypothetical protein D3C57_109235 [Streptomyces rapamycinicus NRRL 5491]UTO66114.1 hypothetical protein LJB45_29880 [Streptomyces rapamycinicus]UTP34068.1 hypothetical protein LIV37_35015 [Streptomyces rapamycinicus NRRL 5491]